MRYLRVGQESESGYPLTESRSFFSIVTPEAGVNIVMNPEPADLSGYSAIGSPTMTHDHTEQRRGIGSVKVIADAANEGVMYLFPEGSPLPANKHFTFSVDIKGPGQIAIFFGTSAGARVGQMTLFNAPKFWNRQSVTILTTDTSVKSVCVIALEPCTFYAGGFQVEAKPYATTFISGNLIAPFDTLPIGQMGYAWMGGPHRAMSYRSADVTNGGRIIPLSDLGFEVTDFMGLGFQAQELLTSRFAFRDNAGYIGTNLADRQFTIGGILKGDGLASLLTKRGVLGTSVVGPERKPLIMQIQLFDEGEPSSEVGEIECVYVSGLEGTIGNLYQERVTINFQAWRPAIVVDGNRSMQLDSDIVGTEEHIAALYPDGLIDAIGPPLDTAEPPAPMAITSNMVIASDNCLYVGCGPFLMRWNGAEWNKACTVTQVIAPFGPPPANYVPHHESIDIMRLCLGPDGRIYMYIRHLTYFGEFTPFDNFDSVNAYSLQTKSIDRLATTTLTLTYPVVGGGSLPGSDATGQSIWMMKDVSRWKPGCIAISGKYMHIHNTNMVVGQIQESANSHLVYYNTATQKWENCLYSFRLLTNGVKHAIVRDFEYDGSGRLFICGNFMAPEDPLDLTDIQTGVFHLAYGEMNNLNAPIYWKKNALLAYTQNVLAGVEAADVRCLYYDATTNLMYVGGTFDRFLMWNTSTGAIIVTSLSPGIATVPTMYAFAWSVSLGVFVDEEDENYEYHSVRHIGRHSDGTIWISGILQSGQNLLTNGSTETVTAGGIILYDPKADKFSRSPLSGYNYDGPFFAAVDDIVFSQQTNLWMSGYTSAPAIDYGEFDPLLSSFTARPGTAGAVYVYAANSGWRTSGATSVAVRVGATAWPRFEVHGPCKMYSIINLTSRRRIVIDREIGVGEIVVIDTLPGHSIIYSSASGIIPPSEASNNGFPEFPLLSGSNRMMVVMDQYTADAACHMTWREEFGSFDGLVKYAR